MFGKAKTLGRGQPKAPARQSNKGWDHSWASEVSAPAHSHSPRPAGLQKASKEPDHKEPGAQQVADTVPLARRSSRFPCSGGTEYLQAGESISCWVHPPNTWGEQTSQLPTLETNLEKQSTNLSHQGWSPHSGEWIYFIYSLTLNKTFIEYSPRAGIYGSQCFSPV